MEYEVLSPRADAEPIAQIGLNPRVADLNRATIGLYATFKEHWVLILDEIARQLKERYPGIQFTHFRYTKDLNSYTDVAELAKDKEVRPEFEEWIKNVDAVIVANADAGSCTLYLTYNASFPERLGKPTVLTVAEKFIPLAKRSAELRGVPALRFARLNIPDISWERDLKPWVQTYIPERVAGALDEIIAGLTDPLTPEEEPASERPVDGPRVVMKGSLQEVNKYLYSRGLTYGMPVMPPTEEAVQEMLTGTDLPADHVVAKLPPLMGRATVEKIAINAVMAGCLPTHLPAVIAVVEALADPRSWVEAYTCSVASWAPLVMINGPVRKDLRLADGVGALSPYKKGNAAIAHALGLIIMNVAGIKDGREDMALFGHEGRFGMCIAENEEKSPWEPLHVHYGFDEGDSAVTISWPNTRYLGIFPMEIGAVLKGMCETIPAFGCDPGCTMIMSPDLARFLAGNGFSRQGLVDYLVEYARVPSPEVNVRWLIGNCHRPQEVPLPLDPTRSVRKFWSGLHLPILVAGGDAPAVVFYGGGGDHGGPVTAKMRLPKDWKALVGRYADYEAGCDSQVESEY